jgi:glycosyltransferase involved in cell wall biosynthesis
MGGHDVQVIMTTPIIGFLRGILDLAVSGGKIDLLILMGVGPKELIAYIAAYVLGVRVLARLGGDRIRDQEAIAASSLKEKRYGNWLRCKINKYFAALLLKKVDGVIVVNACLGKSLTEKVGKSLNIFVVPQFCPGPSVSRKYSINKPIELLTVTNLRFAEKAKGVIWLIEQLREFVAINDVAVNYRIAGDGGHLRDIQEYLRKNETPAKLNVLVAGFVEDLHESYARADVLLYHSTHDATPNVILESKKYGLPLLVNDCEEFRAIVENNVTGLLYGDEADFRKYLKSLLWHEELRKSLGTSAKEEHERKYSVASVSERMEATVLDFFRVSMG